MKRLPLCSLDDHTPIRNRLVYVEWVDARGGSPNWTDLGELSKSKLCLCVSVGILVTCTRDLIVVVPHMSEDSNTGFGEIVIPRGWISRIWDLRVSTEKSPR